MPAAASAFGTSSKLQTLDEDFSLLRIFLRILVICDNAPFVLHKRRAPAQSCPFYLIGRVETHSTRDVARGSIARRSHQASSFPLL